MRQVLAGLRQEATGRTDLSITEGELSVLDAGIHCTAEPFDRALVISQTLDRPGPTQPAAVRMRAEALLHRCRCGGPCALDALASVAQALTELQHDDEPLRSLRLRYALALRIEPTSAPALLEPLPAPIQVRIRSLAMALRPPEPGR